MQLLKTLRDIVSPQKDRTATVTVPCEDAHALLANERRRLIITYLATMEGSKTDAASCADYLAELGDDRTSAYISCIQHHLPRLSQSGAIDYNQSKEVTVKPNLHAVYDAQLAVENTLN